MTDAGNDREKISAESTRLPNHELVMLAVADIRDLFDTVEFELGREYIDDYSAGNYNLRRRLIKARIAVNAITQIESLREMESNKDEDLTSPQATGAMLPASFPAEFPKDVIDRTYRCYCTQGQGECFDCSFSTKAAAINWCKRHSADGSWRVVTKTGTQVWPITKTKTANKSKPHISAAGKKRIAAAQRKRWAKKKAGK